MAKCRLRGWQPPLENVNSLVASGGPRLLARARELVVTNGYAGNACEAFAANLVGDGIKPSSLIEDAAVRDRVQRLWLAWTDEADADGLTDFYGLQSMVAHEMFVAGECFVRLRPRCTEDGLLVPLHLQLLQSEVLPFEKTEDLGGGRRIRCGIEFDAIGRRLVDRAGSMPSLPAIYPDCNAPIIRSGAECRELVMARSCMPTPSQCMVCKRTDPRATSIRRVSSSHSDPGSEPITAA
jgi:Phage portal protein, lambda family